MYGLHAAGASPFGPPAAAGPTLAEALLRTNRQRYGGSATEDELIERVNEIGAARVTTDMALAARSALPGGGVMHLNAGMDMELRDTTTPVGVARKIEVVAADLRLKYFFPGEPQLVLFMLRSSSATPDPRTPARREAVRARRDARDDRVAPPSISDTAAAPSARTAVTAPPQRGRRTRARTPPGSKTLAVRQPRGPCANATPTGPRAVGRCAPPRATD